jgi:CheY-like chemotaxis protein
MNQAVLIVDDNAINVLLASTVLKLAGYEVKTALDAYQTLRILADAIPDLILMDISLPDIDGLTLTRQLKGDPRLASVPVVAFSAFSTAQDEQKACDAGCIGYITKPINTREFAGQVAAFLSSARGAETS